MEQQMLCNNCGSQINVTETQCPVCGAPTAGFERGENYNPNNNFAANNNMNNAPANNGFNNNGMGGNNGFNNNGFNNNGMGANNNGYNNNGYNNNNMRQNAGGNFLAALPPKTKQFYLISACLMVLSVIMFFTITFTIKASVSAYGYSSSSEVDIGITEDTMPDSMNVIAIIGGLVYLAGVGYTQYTCYKKRTFDQKTFMPAMIAAGVAIIVAIIAWLTVGDKGTMSGSYGGASASTEVALGITGWLFFVTAIGGVVTAYMTSKHYANNQ